MTSRPIDVIYKANMSKCYVMIACAIRDVDVRVTFSKELSRTFTFRLYRVLRLTLSQSIHKKYEITLARNSSGNVTDLDKIYRFI